MHTRVITRYFPYLHPHSEISEIISVQIEVVVCYFLGTLLEQREEFHLLLAIDMHLLRP